MAHGVLIVTGGMTHQENYALGFQADPRCRVIAVSDERDVDERRAALNQKLADQLRVPYIRDLGEALARPDIQVASICTEHHRQGRVTIQCAEAGKHLYLDKPICGDLNEARRIEAVVREKRLKSQMFTQVLTPPVLRARRIVSGGGIGDLLAIHHDLHFAKGHAASFPISSRKEDPKPRTFLALDGKREMFNISVYSLAMIRWLTRRKAFQSVRAVTANYFFEEDRRNSFEDFAVLAVTLEGGITATISSGRTGWRSHGGGGHNRIRLIGTRGNAFVDGFAARGEVCTDSQSNWRVPPVNQQDPLGFWASTDQRKTGGPEWFAPPVAVKSDQAAFIDCLEQNREAEVTAADAVRVLEVLFAAYRSAASGESVRL